MCILMCMACVQVLGLLRTLSGGSKAIPVYSDRLSWTTACLRHDLGTIPFGHNNMDALAALAHDEPGVRMAYTCPTHTHAMHVPCT